MKKQKRRKKIKWIIFLGLLVLIIGFRIALPHILLRYVNRQLTHIEGYRGHVNDIDVSLFRGAYTIKGIRLDKVQGKIPVPFFAATSMDISIEWKALFHGMIVAEIEVEKPVLNFVKGPTEATSQTDISTNDWTEVVDNLVPLKLNRFEIKEGEIHYRDYYSKPQVDIFTNHVYILAENISNVKRNRKEYLPSTVTAKATVYDGTANLQMKINPLQQDPLFDMNLSLTDVSLTRFNDFLRAYGNFDVEKGTVNLYTEAAAKEGMISGYTKPIVKDLKVVNWKEDKDKPLKLFWEVIVGTATKLLTNPSAHQLATVVNFKGNIKDPHIDIWHLIGQLLRNAFIQAIYPSLENSININSVPPPNKKPTLLQKIFSKSKQTKKKS